MKMSFLKKTKIICTIGPASIQKETLKEMFKEGMNAARINTAYGNLDQYSQIISNVREIADIPLILDVKGPEIRLQVRKKRRIKEGEVLDIGFGDGEISFNHDFYEDVNISDEIYFDNGKIKTRVVEKLVGKLRLLIMNEGVLADGKGVNIPNRQLSVPSLSDKDIQILEFAKEQAVEYIALSFTRSARDVFDLKSAVDDFKGAVIAKIENFEGVRNFEEILDAVQCIMVARGDLGVEIELEKVPLVQKSIIKRCNQVGKPVVTATDMLESMIYQPIPTRAEVSDIANAILDGADAVMLSGETSIGRHPVESVSIMSRTAKEVESSVKNYVEDGKFVDISNTVSKSIQKISQTMPISTVVTLTRSGYTARMISRFRISQPIIAVTQDEQVRKQLELVFGVYPVQMDYKNEDDRILAVAKRLHSMKLISDDDTVLFTAAFRTTVKHASNLIEIHNIGELMKFTGEEP